MKIIENVEAYEKREMGNGKNESEKRSSCAL
jgi:hypothetical protein